MEKLLQLKWRYLRPPDGVAERMRDKVARLERHAKPITGCAVMLEAASRHHRQSSSQYRVRIELSVPGGRLVVGRDSSKGPVHADLYSPLNAAFREARRQLQEHARRMRHMVKTHDGAPRAVVVRIFPGKGHGALGVQDGREIYFHEHRTLRGGFRRVCVGDPVRFVEEAGDGTQRRARWCWPAGIGGWNGAQALGDDMDSPCSENQAPGPRNNKRGDPRMFASTRGGMS